MIELIGILIILITQVCIGSTCQTNAEGRVKNAQCVFPFTYQEQTFTSCTDFKDPDGKLWCSTKVDEKGSHVKHQWGYCDSTGLLCICC